MRARLGWVGLAVLAMAVAACGESGDAGTTTTTTTVAETTTSTIATTTTSSVPTTVPATTTSTSVEESTTTTGTSSGLPGEPIDFGPAEGDTLAVIGVAHDDVLNLRAAPGADQEILDGIPPLYDDLTALGETRQLPGSMWIRVDYDGSDGWVNIRFIGYLGDTTDATADIVESLGEVPGAETMLDLGQIVAESLASDEPVSDIVLTVAPTVGDLGEVTYDVVGLGDDAVRGLRVHVFGQPGDESFTLDTVEITTLCGRGVDGDGFCI